MSNNFSFILYDQLVHRVLNPQMKHDCEFVIIGLEAMQGCSYFKS